MSYRPPLPGTRPPLGYVYNAEPPFGLLRLPFHPAFSQKVIDDESNIEALMPKLRHSYYYTKPTIEELAVKERAEPGYCHRGLRGFVVGRDGVGSIKFLGRTDVRWLDLESFITFDDDGRFTSRFEKTNPVHDFSSTAEITLLVNKEEIDVQTLISKTTSDSKKGLEFVSYDPVNEEVKFQVKYLSTLGKIQFFKRRSLRSKMLQNSDELKKRNILAGAEENDERQ
ncbi:hypothetical protein OSB04_029621 [Centaurea solstitialis]|uniref:Peptidase S59 domain-containing protein n=1 Tax=Centaurea solstitialis TaxID=347529 RepID=A0AA38SRD7_9ASTR|nr:hypothetical protein OSB04_029621 [Centaurea solstitialis]